MEKNGVPAALGSGQQEQHAPIVLENDEISILDILLVLTRNRRLILYTTFLFTAAGLLYTLTATPEYTASAQVIREAADGSQSGLAGLSMLRGLGINVGGSSTGLTVDAYPEVLVSREVLLAVVRDTFRVRGTDSQISFIDYLNQPGGLTSRLLGSGKRDTDIEYAPGQQSKVPTKKEAAAIRVLTDKISTSVDARTGLMTISVTTEDPQLSAALVQSLLQNLTERVQEIHTEKARLNVEFIRARFEETRAKLHQAEETLARFLDQNQYPQTAQLRTELERLQRNVVFSSNLYSELQTQLTQAEIDLQKTRPAVTVVEYPIPPINPSAPNRALIIVFTIVLGLFAGIAIAFMRSVLDRHSSNDETLHKLEEIGAAFNLGVLSPRVFSRSVKRRPHSNPH